MTMPPVHMARIARTRSLLCALLMSWAVGASATPVDAAAGATPACLQAVLAQLGWRFERGDGARLDGHAGRPCERADLVDAHGQGDLRARLPSPTADQAQLTRDLGALLSHPGTRCAYAMQLGTATRRAVDRLVANRDFRFSALQTGWIGFGAGGARRDGWRAIRSFGRGFVPLDSPTRAIEGFYRGRVRAECGVGRQIAQYATLRELFGDEAFDARFDADEIVIGTFNELHRTRSVLLGASAGEFTRDGKARLAAAEGRQAFAGLPGFIVHVLGKEMLDDIHNQAENYVVYGVSAAAAESLRDRGGFEPFNRRALELWQLSRDLDLTADRIFERLLHERDDALLAAIAPRKQATIRRMRALLDDPFFQGFRIYVHPKGVQPVAFHFARLLDRNPRTPFRIELALHNLHTTIYRRWLDAQLAQCATDASLPAVDAQDGRAGSAHRNLASARHVAFIGPGE